MPESPLRLIKGKVEFVAQADIGRLPRGLRGVYALFDGNQKEKIFNVRYIGMSATGIRARLKSHRRSKRRFWSHCSVFQVWDNIRDDEIKELEGLLRHIYRSDEAANQLNEMKSFKAFDRVEAIELLSETRSESSTTRRKRCP